MTSGRRRASTPDAADHVSRRTSQARIRSPEVGQPAFRGGRSACAVPVIESTLGTTLSEGFTSMAQSSSSQVDKNDKDVQPQATTRPANGRGDTGSRGPTGPVGDQGAKGEQG